MKAASIALLSACALVSTPFAARAQCPALEVEALAPDDAAAGDFFGYSVDVDGDVAIVGAINDDVGGVSGAGSATLFRLVGGGWHAEDRIVANDPVTFVGFGHSVAVSGNRALVGVPNLTVSGQNLAGAVYAFSFDGSGWTQDQKLIASDFDHLNAFGRSVALDGDVAVIGSPTDDIGPLISAGSAYVFRHDGTQWLEEVKLTTSDAYRQDQFGWACAVQGQRAVISAVGEGGPLAILQGAAYVFEHDGSQWNEVQKLLAGDGAGGDQMGYSIDMDADVIVAGAYAAAVGGFDGAGAAYVFRDVAGVWTEEQKLLPPVAGTQDQFGSAVGADGQHVVVGEQGDAGFIGAAYLFSHDGSAWQTSQEWTSTDGGNSDSFGRALAVDGGKAVIGADGADTGAGINSGSAYAFDVEAAAVGHRNAGANPDSYTASAPILGGLWTASIDLTTTGHSHALVLMNTTPGMTVLPLGQVLLVGGVELLQLPLTPGPVVNWALTIPDECSLVGVTIATQAAHAQAVFPFALSNAQDLTFGY